MRTRKDMKAIFSEVKDGIKKLMLAGIDAASKAGLKPDVVLFYGGCAGSPEIQRHLNDSLKEKNIEFKAPDE
jgi:hypothetical protein